MRRILTIDGGGIKGVAPASLLAHVEESLPHQIGEYFDLIVGTSTGGIIALAFGLGLSARETLAFYERHGPTIFYGNPRFKAFRRWFRAKYDPRPLRTALEEVFGARKLGESAKRLVVPSFNIDTGEVHVWKTSHHPRFERDYKSLVVDVALSTAAAPTYFPTHQLACGTPLIDGGMWATIPSLSPLSRRLEFSNGLQTICEFSVWAAQQRRLASIGAGRTPLENSAGPRRSPMCSWPVKHPGRWAWRSIL